MTDEEATALTMLHAPSTCDHTSFDGCAYSGGFDPFYRGVAGWWVYRGNASTPNFPTIGAAAQHYCKFYNLKLEDRT